MGGFALLTVQRSTAPGRWPLVLEWGLPEGLLTRAEGELRLDDDARAALIAQPPEPYGRRLGELVFLGEILAALAAARAAFPERLRLLVSLEDPDLGDLHWERLAVPKDGDWTAAGLDGGLSFARLVPSRSSRIFALAGPEPRTLAFISSPAGVTKFPEFSADDVAAAIRKAAPHVTLLGTSDRPPASLEALMGELQVGDYATLVIVAHGFVDAADHELLLQNKKREHAPTTATELFAQLHKLPRLPRLVVLVVCESATRCKKTRHDLGTRLVLERGVPATVAMAGRFTVASGIPWIERFLREVHTSGDVELAIGRAADAITTKDDALFPVLSVRLRGHRLFEEGGYVLPSGTPLADLLSVTRGSFARRAPSVAETVATLTAVLERADATAEQRDRARRELDELCIECLDLELGALVGGARPEPNPESPFVGLRAFGYDDRGVFFGREKLAGEIAQRLRNERFLAITGPSGSGKSSLLFAGVIPELRAADPALEWRSFRPGPRPYDALVKASAELAAIGAPTRLLVVDQFEELFTQGADPAEVERFLEELLRLSASTWITLTVRADFYEDCTEHAAFGDRFKRHLEPVRRMTELELRNAMERQAETAGLRLDPALAARILEEVRGAPGAMPLVQHLLQEVWHRRRGRWLRTSAYEEVGGVRHALVTTAEELFRSLKGSEQTAVREILLRLTRPDEGGSDHRDARRRVELEQLVPAGESLEHVHALVKRLADVTLVVTSTDPVSAKEVVEVAHEELIRSWDRLRGWLDEHRGARLLLASVERSAQEWKDGGRHASLLVHQGVRLAAVAGVIEKSTLRPNKLEAEYLGACRLAERRKHRLRWGVGAAAGGVALAATISIIVMWALGRSEKAQRVRHEEQAAIHEAQLHFLRAENFEAAGRYRDAFQRAALAAATLPEGHPLRPAYNARAAHLLLTSPYPQGRLPVELRVAAIHENGELIVGTAQGQCYLFILQGRWRGGQLRAGAEDTRARTCDLPVASADGKTVAALLKHARGDARPGWGDDDAPFRVAVWNESGELRSDFEVPWGSQLYATGNWFVVHDGDRAVVWRDPAKTIEVADVGPVSAFVADDTGLVIASAGRERTRLVIRRVSDDGLVSPHWSPSARDVGRRVDTLRFAPGASALVGISSGERDALSTHLWRPKGAEDVDEGIEGLRGDDVFGVARIFYVSRDGELAVGEIETTEGSRLLSIDEGEAEVIDPGKEDVELLTFGGGGIGAILEEKVLEIVDDELDDEIRAPLYLRASVARTITDDHRLVVLHPDGAVSVAKLGSDAGRRDGAQTDAVVSSGVQLTSSAGSAPGMRVVSAASIGTDRVRWEWPIPESAPSIRPFWIGSQAWGYLVGDELFVRRLRDNVELGHVSTTSPGEVLVVAQDRVIERESYGLLVRWLDGRAPLRMPVAFGSYALSRDGRVVISSMAAGVRLDGVGAQTPGGQPRTVTISSSDGGMLRLARALLVAADTVHLDARPNLVLLTFGERVIELTVEGASLRLRNGIAELDLAPCDALDAWLAVAAPRDGRADIASRADGPRLLAIARNPRWVAFVDSEATPEAIVCDLVGGVRIATIEIDEWTDLGWGDRDLLLTLSNGRIAEHELLAEDDPAPWWIPLAQALTGETGREGGAIAIPPSWVRRLWTLARMELEAAKGTDSAAAVLRFLDAAPEGVVER